MPIKGVKSGQSEGKLKLSGGYIMCEKIKCADCEFAKPDLKASEEYWKAYECVNISSKYYKALLNVAISGERQYQITWVGCDEGRAKS
jgi:hypothetical protein